MTPEEISRIVENEKEWRQHILKSIDDLDKKVDALDNELSTFKIRVFTFASVFGAGAGASVQQITKFFLGE